MEEFAVRLGCTLMTIKDGYRVPARITDGIIYVPSESVLGARMRAIGMLCARFCLPARETLVYPINTHPFRQEDQTMPTFFERIEGFEGLAEKVA